MFKRLFARRSRPKHDQPREDCRYYIMDQTASKMIWIVDYDQANDLFVSPYDTKPPLLHGNVVITVLEPGESEPAVLGSDSQAYQKLVAQLRK